MSILAGAAIGVVVPAVLLGLILLLRLGGSLGLLVFEHVAWRENLEVIANRGPMWSVLLGPLCGIDSLLWGAPWARVLSVIFIGGSVLVWFWKRGPAPLIVGAVGVVFLPALAHDVDVLGRLLLASLLLWLVPGVALGIAVPFLREPKVRYWSVIAAVSGALLAILAKSQASWQPELAAAALAFVLAGIFIAAPDGEEFTLLVALVSGLAIYALALIPATVLGVASDVVFVVLRPAQGAPGLTRGELLRLGGAGAIDTAIAQYPELHRALPGKLADVHAELRGLEGEPFPARGSKAQGLKRRVLAELLAQRRAELPFLAQRELAILGAEGAWLDRARWLEAAGASLKRMEKRLETQRDAEQIRGAMQGRGSNQAARLNASLGGAIGYTVTLALLAAWRIKDRDARATPRAH